MGFLLAGGVPMQETLGTLNLKIARLEQILKVLKQRQAMSERYPTYKANLIKENLKVQRQLRYLVQYREKLLSQHSTI